MPEFVLIIFIIIFAIWLYFTSNNKRVLGYNISGNELLIKRKKNSIAIDLQEIIVIKEIKEFEKFSFWLFNFIIYGFILGETGLSFSFQYGILHLYMKQKKEPLILFLRNNQKIVITPNNEIKTQLMYLISK
jgi:hypothetical protein